MKLTKQQLNSVTEEELLKEQEAKTDAQAKKFNSLIAHFSIVIANSKGIPRNVQTDVQAKFRIAAMVRAGRTPEQIWDAISQLIAKQFMNPNVMTPRE